MLTRRKVEVNVLNTLKMVVDGIGVDFTPNKAGLVMYHFCRGGGLRAGSNNVFLSIHLPYKEAKDDKGTCTEHTCYGCWAREAKPALEVFLQTQKMHQQVQVHLCRRLWLTRSQCVGILGGTCVDAVGRLEAQRAEQWHQTCKAVRPPNRNCDEELLAMSCCVSVDCQPDAPLVTLHLHRFQHVHFCTSVPLSSVVVHT